MKIKIADTFKVIDIHYQQIPENVYKFLQSHATYGDLVLKEHLVSPDNLLDDEEALVNEVGWQEQMRPVLQELKKLQDKHGAAYIRFTTM